MSTTFTKKETKVLKKLLRTLTEGSEDYLLLLGKLRERKKVKTIYSDGEEVYETEYEDSETDYDSDCSSTSYQSVESCCTCGTAEYDTEDEIGSSTEYDTEDESGSLTEYETDSDSEDKSGSSTEYETEYETESESESEDEATRRRRRRKEKKMKHRRNRR